MLIGSMHQSWSLLILTFNLCFGFGLTILVDYAPGPTINAADCTSADPLSKCKNIFIQGTVAANLTTAFESFESQMDVLFLQTSDIGSFEAIVLLVCKISQRMNACVTTVLTTCTTVNNENLRSEANVFMNTNNMMAASRVYCNAAVIIPTKVVKMTANYASQCLQTGVGKDWKDRVVQLITRFRTMRDSISASVMASVAAYVNYNDGSLSASASASASVQKNIVTVKGLCGMLRSDIYEMRSKLRKSNTCPPETKEMLIDQFRLHATVVIGSMCHLSTYPADNSAKANPRDKQRTTMVFCGCGHYKAFNSSSETTYETCNDRTNVEVVLLNHDSIRVTGTLGVTSVLDVMFFTKIKVEMFRSDGSLVDSVFLTDVSGNIKASFAASSSTTINSDGVKMKGKISLETTSNMKLNIRDYNSGCFIAIYKFVTTKNIIIYTVVIRCPQSMIEESGGLLTSGCVNNIDINAIVSGKRRKRAASSTTAETYDQQKTDSNSNMVATSESDAYTAKSEDGDMSNSATVPTFVTTLMLSNILIGLLLRFVLIN